MRTNIVIDDELLNEAFSVSNAKTKKDLIHEALKDFHLPISVQRTERPTCDWMVSMKNNAAAKPIPAAIMNIPRKPNKSDKNPRETPAEITPISKAP